MSLKVCKKCGLEKEAIKGIWVTTKGKPEGRVCLKCTASKAAEKRLTIEGAAAVKKACAKFYARKRSTPEGRAEYAARSRKYLENKKATADGRDKLAEYYRKYVEANRDKLGQYSREYNKARRLTVEGSECAKAATKAYRAKNVGKVATWRLARRTAEQQRTPKWLTAEQLRCIDAKYAMARWLSDVVGVAYHVDHIIPLNGTLVSGLHVPDNLRVVRAEVNLAKGNKWEP